MTYLVANTIRSNPRSRNSLRLFIQFMVSWAFCRNDIRRVLPIIGQ